jgi:hypothetical protein
VLILVVLVGWMDVEVDVPVGFPDPGPVMAVVTEPWIRMCDELDMTFVEEVPFSTPVKSELPGIEPRTPVVLTTVIVEG